MAHKYNLGDNIPNDSKKETNSSHKSESSWIKLLIKYPYRLKYIFWNCHFGKLLVLLIIIAIIIILIWNNYNINGDYPELSDAEKKQLEDNGEDIDKVLRNYRFLTLLLNLCMGLLSGILSIILGVESYKSLLAQREKNIQMNHLSIVKYVQNIFNKLKRKIYIGTGQSEKSESEKYESEKSESEFSVNINSTSETTDTRIKKTEEKKEEKINELEKEIKQIDYIIEDEEKAKIMNNIKIEIANISNSLINEIKDEIKKDDENKTELESLITQLSTINHIDS